MFKKPIVAILFAITIFLAGAEYALAGFGISPPYVKSNQLVPGSHFEQQIMLLRSSAEEDLKAEITVNAPEIKDWISIDKGNSFVMPKGQLQVPMIVNVDAPKDAELGSYKGYINIRIVPANPEKGGVAIALGARVDVDLALTNVTFADFAVRIVSIPDFEKLGKPWNWKYWEPIFNHLFYKVRVSMNIENKGNIETAPTKVHLDVYDIGEKQLLESGDDRKVEKIKAFSVQEVQASFPTKLPVGQYWGKVKIYKDNEIVNTYKLAFTIAEPGGLGGKAISLGVWPWIVMVGIILFGLIILGVLIRIKIWRYFFALLGLVFRPVWRKIKEFGGNMNTKFWKWIHEKSSEKTGRYDKDK